MKEFIVKCSRCNTLIVTKADQAGGFVDCPRCQAVVEARAAERDGLDADIRAGTASRTTTFTMSLPTRAPNEPDVNAEQRAEIKALGGKMDPEQLKDLGTWQAEAVIRRIREEKKVFAEAVANAARVEQARRDLKGCVLALVLIGLFALLLWYGL